MGAAIVNGITGQDGSYLAELLLLQGDRVVGVVRDMDHALAALSPSLIGKVELFAWDMRGETRLRELLVQSRPGSFYNLAAYARGSAMYDNPVSIGEVNGLAVARILEAIRETDPTIRFCQASSSEMFGDTTESPQSEESPMRPTSPYGAAKHYGHSMVRIYRQRYGIFACSAILFNHESPRRGLAYVTRKITHTAAKIKAGQACELRLGNLDARRDWGFAPDYARAMNLMLTTDRADDYVVATGEQHSVREFCACAFEHIGMNYRDFVVEDPGLFRASDEIQIVGDAAKAKRVLRWRPTVTFREMVALMVDNDLGLLEKAT